MPIEVQRFAIEGNTAIDTQELLALVAPLTGQARTLSELEEGIARITRRYRERGYPFAYAYLPAQTVDAGLLKVAVIEGRLGAVRVDNASRQRGAAAAPLARLTSGDVLRADALESSLLLLGDVSGLRAEATLQPGAALGTSDLVVKLTDAPLVSGALGADNFGNRHTGAYRALGSFQLLTANFARWQSLSGPWSLHGRINGQWANSNLDSSEKMSLGGGYGVRANPQGEASGDHGLLAALELRYALAGSWQLSGFADAGKVKLQHRPWSAGSNHRRLSGAGVGLQRNGRDWSLETALAWSVGGVPATSAPDKRPRLWVKAQKLF